MQTWRSALGAILRTRTRSPRAFFTACMLFIVAPFLFGWWWYESRMFIVQVAIERELQPSLIPAVEELELLIVPLNPISLLTSYFVINEALRAPQLSSLPVVEVQSDPVQWINNSIEIGCLRATNPRRLIYFARMRARQHETEQVRQLLDGLAAAYNKIVIYPNIQKRLIIRDTLVHSIRQIDKEVCQLQRRDAVGPPDDSDVTDAGVQAEAKKLISIREAMSLQLEQMNVENQGEGGLSPILPAEIRRE